MKRFAVLFGLIAISTLVVTTSTFAEAPAVQDLPDLRLLYDDGGAVSGTLQETLMDAYNVFDFVKDFNDASVDLTVSISDIQAPAGTIEASDGLVDVYGGASTGWAQYTVTIDDASTSAPKREMDPQWSNFDVAVAKFSTFSVDGPTVSTGRGFTPLADANTQYCQRVWLGETLVTPDVPIDPSSQSVSWEIFVNGVTINDASLNYDLNGNYMGKVTELLAQADQGDVVSVGGLGWLVDAQGALQISGAGSMSPGPWLVGLMATDTGDPDNQDAARLMVATGLLGVATKGNTPDHGGAETFESLTPGTIPAAVDQETNLLTGGWQCVEGYVATLDDLVDTIGTGSHWCYNIMSSGDSFVDSVPLEIVNLATDPGAPDEVSGVGEGQCLKAVIGGAALDPTLDNGLRNEGFRVSSRLFANIEYGKVYTFAMSIATNATTTAQLPRYQMFMTAGDGGLTSGYENTGVGSGLLAALGWATQPQLPLPLAAQGWMTLSVNYTAAATPAAADLNGDGVFDATDQTLRFQMDLKPKGATDPDPLKYAQAVIRFWAQTAASDATVWIDNMRVFESMYELDLANGAEVLNDHFWSARQADMDELATLGLLEESTGAFDGTIEAFEDTVADMHADLLDIGISTTVYNADGARFGGINGGLVTKKKYSAYDSSYAVTSGAGIDHTRNAGSDTALKITLKGPSTELPTTEQIVYQASFSTDTIATDGEGLYAFEAYLAAEAPFNQTTSTRRMPQIYMTCNEIMPSPLGNNAGVILAFGGLPDIAGDIPFNWQRVVVSIYSPASECIRGTFQLLDTPGKVGNPVQMTAFNVPIYIDDMKFYKVADNLDQFDAELFE